jgi:hypothetical protein
MDAIARRVPVSGNPPWRRVLVGGWTFAAVALLWYGLSGVVTWLLHGPWTRLLVATDGFGTWPCVGPIGSGCVDPNYWSFAMVPVGGARFPYALVALVGAVVLAALLVLRAVTRLGTPAWTPSRASMAFGLAVPFFVAGGLWVLYGVVNVAYGDFSRLSYVDAGVLALVVAGTAVIQRRRR